MKNRMLKIVIYTVFLTLTIGLISSCCPCKNIQNSINNDHKDSSWTKTEIKWRDSIYNTPVDSAAIMAMVICPPSGIINTPVFTKKSKQATITAAIINNQLIAKCKCDSIEFLLKQKETLIEGYRLQATHRTEIKVVTEKYIPLWVKILAWIGGSSMPIIILIIYIKTL